MVNSERSWLSNDAGLLCYKDSVEERFQILVPARQQTTLMSYVHHPKFSEHSMATRIYNILQQHYYWRHMAQDVHADILQNNSCWIDRPFDKQPQVHKLFPVPGPLEFVAIDILDSLTQTETRNQYFVAMPG